MVSTRPKTFAESADTTSLMQSFKPPSRAPNCSNIDYLLNTWLGAGTSACNREPTILHDFSPPMLCLWEATISLHTLLPIHTCAYGRQASSIHSHNCGWATPQDYTKAGHLLAALHTLMRPCGTHTGALTHCCLILSLPSCWSDPPAQGPTCPRTH